MANPARPPKARAPLKLPKELGALADMLLQLDQKWDVEAAEHAEKERQYKADRTQITDYMFQHFDEAKMEGALGKRSVVEVERTPVATPKDWPKIWAYIKKYNAWELLHKRLSSTAVRERWEAGKEIPGIDKFIAKKITAKPRKEAKIK